MKLVFLGCGSWVSPPHLIGMGIAVVDGDKYVLLDCGPNIPENLVGCGLSHLDPIAVVVTHMHGDHVLGLPTFLMWLRFRRAERKVKIVGTKPMLDSIDRLLELVGAPRASVAEFVEIDPEREIEIEDFRVVLREAKHTVYSLIAKICRGDECVAYACDTAPFDELKEFAKGCKVLVYECSGIDREEMHRIGHSTPLDAVEIAKSCGVKVLALVHPGFEPITLGGAGSLGFKVVVPYPCYEVEVRG